MARLRRYVHNHVGGTPGVAFLPHRAGLEQFPDAIHRIEPIIVFP